MVKYNTSNRNVNISPFEYANRYITDSKLTQYKIETIEGIIEYRPLIHRIIFYSNKYTYNDYAKWFYGLKLAGPEALNKSSNFTKAMYAYFKKSHLTIYLNPIKGITKSRIAMSNPTEEWLISLYKVLPNLRISRFEAAFDFLCINNEGARRFFYLLEKYAYFPWQRETKPKLVQKNPQYNYIYWVTQGNNLLVKMYERGEDRKKIRSGVNRKGKWLYDDIDKVRIEFTYQRQYHFKKHQIKSLLNFIRNFRMEKLLYRMFRLRTFKGGSHFPFENDFFTAFEGNSPIPFQKQYWMLRKEFGKNTAKHTAPPKHLDVVDQNLLNEITKFDKRWAIKSKLLIDKPKRIQLITHSICTKDSKE